MALHYCKKCGRVIERKPDKTGYKDNRCDYCKSKVYPVPEKYWLDGLDFLITNEQETLLREELVKTSPEFDEYLFNHRDSDLQQHWSKIESALEHGKAILEGKDKGNSLGIKCPYCNATNIKKISSSTRIVSTGLFGLGSKKIGKQWHCNHCGSDF